MFECRKIDKYHVQRRCSIFFVICLISEVIMTKTSARKWQAAKKNFKKVFEDNDKENAKSRPSVYSVYLHKKICMLCIIDPFTGGIR